jgi:hypothetical protein
VRRREVVAYAGPVDHTTVAQSDPVRALRLLEASTSSTSAPNSLTAPRRKSVSATVDDQLSADRRGSVAVDHRDPERAAVVGLCRGHVEVRDGRRTNAKVAAVVAFIALPYVGQPAGRPHLGRQRDWTEVVLVEVPDVLSRRADGAAWTGDDHAVRIEQVDGVGHRDRHLEPAGPVQCAEDARVEQCIGERPGAPAVDAV